MCMYKDRGGGGKGNEKCFVLFCALMLFLHFFFFYFFFGPFLAGRASPRAQFFEWDGSRETTDRTDTQ